MRTLQFLRHGPTHYSSCIMIGKNLSHLGGVTQNQIKSVIHNLIFLQMSQTLKWTLMSGLNVKMIMMNLQGLLTKC
ncbi:hypothetical protein HOLleu_03360 [Holothuria leucospilota]|uniref:Uncharacterized protein n=1 Tax=Holothuria leucospilota TaxID=206669 RepID=A0A9Q1CQP5_HOLLE|nr:hypothetical protein HOLleu_03360 [Holothuria leucospilota]